ncbi:MAG TPA: 3D domain-containing protein [bacterium]|nr:3D domain-containing protein [bacterium]
MNLKGWPYYLLTAAAVLAGWTWDQHRLPPVHLVLFQDAGPVTLSVRGRTVGEALSDGGFRLDPHDVVAPPPDTPVVEGMEVDLGQVERKVTTEKRKVHPPVQRDYTDTLNVGEIIDLETGQDGEQEVTTETYRLNGEDAFEKVVGVKVLKASKPARVLEGTSMRRKLYPLQKRAQVRKILTLEATAYYPGPEDTWPFASGTTASGLKAGYGVVAVDRRVIPLKTRLYVEGYGYAIAADTGGAIKGMKIDLCYDTYEEAVRFGRKKVKVYLLR